VNAQSELLDEILDLFSYAHDAEGAWHELVKRPTAPAAAAPIPAPPPQVLSAPKKIHTIPYRADQSGAADAKPEPTPPAAPIALANASSTAAVAPSVSGGGYAV